MTPNSPDEAFWGGISGRFRDRAVQGSNAWRNFVCSGFSRAKSQGLRGFADWWIADCSLRVR
eukprot:4991489-Alexandrium_andersonii.AAC.1